MEAKIDSLLEAQANLDEKLVVINTTLLSLPQCFAAALADNKNDKIQVENNTESTEEVNEEVVNDNIPHQG